MGYNSTLVILNDGLHEIEKDPEFGAKVAQAIRSLMGKGGQDIMSGRFMNCARVIETHHADGMKLIAVGGNCGQDLGYVGSYRSEAIDMLRTWAEEMGYRLVRKPTKVSRSVSAKGDGDAG